MHMHVDMEICRSVCLVLCMHVCMHMSVSIYEYICHVRMRYVQVLPCFVHRVTMPKIQRKMSLSPRVCAFHVSACV